MLSMGCVSDAEAHRRHQLDDSMSEVAVFLVFKGVSWVSRGRVMGSEERSPYTFSRESTLIDRHDNVSPPLNTTNADTANFPLPLDNQQHLRIVI